MIGEPQPRPLWTCPSCGHQFVSANIWHSCTKIALGDAFARTTGEARAAFDRFVELIERCGPVAVIAQKSRIVVMARVRFAGATVLRNRIRLSFALTRRIDAPWLTGIESYGPRWNAHRFEAARPADVDAIDDLPRLLCESYHDLGLQEALRRRPAPARRRA